MSETPLEKLIETLCDTDDLTDAEVREELAAEGVDVDAAKARFMPKLDDLMRARAVRLALAAVRDNPLPTDSTSPWSANAYLWSGEKRVPMNSLHVRAHIAAAVNAAPVLAAEVEKLTADLATLQARFDDLHSAAQEVAEVARLRDEFNPPDDGRIWVSRWQNALSDLKNEVDNG